MSYIYIYIYIYGISSLRVNKAFVTLCDPHFHFVRQSVLMEQLGFYWTDFHKILLFENFSKIFRENSSLIEI